MQKNWFWSSRLINVRLMSELCQFLGALGTLLGVLLHIFIRIYVLSLVVVDDASPADPD